MRRAAVGVVLSLLVASAPGAGRASGGSLPSVPAGPLPGPSLLYEPLASAPQLHNGAGWEAAPLMVSGADAYAGHEYQYQDYVYDDFGANTTDVPFAPPDPVPAAGDVAFGGQTGDVVYPTDDATYAYDAADLLEFRARPDGTEIVYRITLNTMRAPDAAGVAIGIDADRDVATGKDDWGYGIGSLGHLGLDHVLVTWGDHAEMDGVSVSSTVDVTTNQIEVRAPIAPSGVMRTYVAAGLFDAGAKTFKQILDDPTATQPGGAHGTTPPPIFNVGFRFNEPMIGAELYRADPAGVTESGSRTTGVGNWRDHAQAKALAARDISAMHADIDFGKLAAGTDESHVPTHGYISRLYSSHTDLGEGAQPTRPMLLGQVQPYSIYVLASYDGSPAPFTLLLHSLSSSYNQYQVFAPHLYDQLGEQRGSFMLAPEGRGPDGWWHDSAEADAFEAWADAAAHYAFDPLRVTITGYSMGGYGTFKFASQYPDLFARGFAVVGPADEAIQGGPTGGLSEDDQNTLNIADNLRNVPLLMWEGTNDELVPLAGTLQYEKRLADLGYRHEQVLWLGYDHFLESIVDQWDEGRDFLGAYGIDRDPEQVVYRAMPEMDSVQFGLTHDHAYWVGDVKPRAGARSALIDARSEATRVGRPVAFPWVSAGIYVQPVRGGYVTKGTDWQPTTQDSSNRLDLTLTGVASATLWIERARIDPSRPLTISATSDGTTSITLAGSFGAETITVNAGDSQTTLSLE